MGHFSVSSQIKTASASVCFQMSVCSSARELYSLRNHSGHQAVTNHGNEMMEYRRETHAKSLKTYLLYLGPAVTPRMTSAGGGPSVKSKLDPAFFFFYLFF